MEQKFIRKGDLVFGRCLRKLREDAGETQVELARKLSVVPASISHWENGASNPSIEYIRRICTHYDVTPEQLLDIENIENKQLHTTSGLTWRARPISSPDIEYSRFINDGVKFFKRVVGNNQSRETVRGPDYVNIPETQLRRSLSAALLSQVVEICGVNREKVMEEQLKKFFPGLPRACYVADIDIPDQSWINATIRTETIAWLASKLFLDSLGSDSHFTVGLSGGTTISRFIDQLKPLGLNKLTSIVWVPLLSVKFYSSTVLSSANNLVARVVHDHPGAKGFYLPYISSKKRGPDYLKTKALNSDDEILVSEARRIIGMAENADHVFFSVGSSEDEFKATETNLGMQELHELYSRLISDDQKRCVGDVLLHLIDQNGNQIGDSQIKAENEELANSIRLDDLKHIAARGTVWLLSSRPKKAKVIYACLKAGFVSCLVVDSLTAKVLIDLAERDRAGTFTG